MPDFDPDLYWDERGGKGYMESVDVPEYRLHLNYQQEWLLGLVMKHKPKRLLDFGCGTGVNFFCWKSVPEVFAYDRSRTMLHQARILARQEGRDYRITSPDSANRAMVPYKDDMFDFVAMATVLAHMMPPDFSMFAKELRRISKPESVWAIITAAPFDDGSIGYMWNHNYEDWFGQDVKILDDHNFGPYRYIEAVYGGQQVVPEAGGVDTIQVDGPVRGHSGADEESAAKADCFTASSGFEEP